MFPEVCLPAARGRKGRAPRPSSAVQGSASPTDGEHEEPKMKSVFGHITTRACPRCVSGGHWRALPEEVVVMQVATQKAADRPRGRVGTSPEPLAVARQVDPRHPALRRAHLPLGRVLRPDPDRVLRGAIHRALPAGDLRLQRRRAALVVARQLLHLRCPRHRRVPAIHARGCARVPRTARDRLPAEPPPRSPAPGLVVARHPAVLYREHLSPEPDGVSGSSASSSSSPASWCSSRIDTRRTSSTSCSASTAGCCVYSPTRRS